MKFRRMTQPGPSSGMLGTSSNRRLCFFSAASLVLGFALASVFFTLHVTTVCPIFSKKYRKDLDDARSTSFQTLTEAERLNSISGPHDTAFSTWQPWQLPSDLLKHFPTEQGAKLDPRRFHLHIKLLTFDRLGPATRFLNSLQRVNFLGDSVSLEVRVLAARIRTHRRLV